jgi:uncharacterized membrane protein YphA (DoxX/SURF4 family)
MGTMTYDPSKQPLGGMGEGGGIWLARKALGLVFIMAGVMKLAVPTLADAFSGQLIAANLPLYDVARWAVPITEVVVGLMMFFRLLVRPAALAMLGMMGGAIYVHLTVEDAALFPLQPSEPVIPILVIALALIVLIQSR